MNVCPSNKTLQMCYDLIMLWLTLVCCQQLAEPPPVFSQGPDWMMQFPGSKEGAMGCVGGQLSLHGVCVWHWAQSCCLEISLRSPAVNWAYPPTLQGTMMEQGLEDVFMVSFMCSDLWL